jgi:hypothetical protein
MKSSAGQEGQIIQQGNSGELNYTIPLRYRKMENLHIVFWLIKDISWCLFWRPLGIAMIFPTLFFAILITVRTRQIMSEACHNLAVTLWIMANAYWMLCEFFLLDGIKIIDHIGIGGMVFFKNLTYKDIAVIPFIAGITVLAYYYLWWKPRNREVSKTM